MFIVIGILKWEILLNKVIMFFCKIFKTTNKGQNMFFTFCFKCFNIIWKLKEILSWAVVFCCDSLWDIVVRCVFHSTCLCSDMFWAAMGRAWVTTIICPASLSQSMVSQYLITHMHHCLNHQPFVEWDYLSLCWWLRTFYFLKTHIFVWHVNLKGLHDMADGSNRILQNWSCSP